MKQMLINSAFADQVIVNATLNIVYIKPSLHRDSLNLRNMQHNWLLACLSLFASCACAANDVLFNFAGKSFYNEQHVLMLKAGDQLPAYEVNTSVITVKPRVNSLRNQLNGFYQQNGFQVLRTAATGFMDLQLSGANDYQSELLKLANSGLFAVVEPTSFGRYTFIPNDTQYSNQWHLPQVSAPAAWDLNAGVASVVVAVLDSGTDFNHEDLAAGPDAFDSIWRNPGEDAWADPTDPTTGNGIDDDNNGYIDDWIGYNFDQDTNDGSGLFDHGTGVAGVVAAKTNNKLGVAGVAGGNNSAGVAVMIGNIGSFAPNGAVLDDAILYAAENGARIIQLSLTIIQSAAIDAAINAAYINHGVLVVNAAGNSATPTVDYPASHVNVMAVGASNQFDGRVSTSQYGPNLEIAAPGVDILTTTIGSAYVSMTGTSFSAPMTSGVAALVLSRNPMLTHVQVREILRNSADKVGGYDYDYDVDFPGRSLEFGYGRLNAHAALLLSDSYQTLSGAIFLDGFEGDVIFKNGYD
ncbi:S8 family serine peptidase [Marinicella litoralis]|uniref:Subtilisin family serine protease n=1 Tax=Marinicella litoralis TaxID=644220 RepID=A0A4R6XFU5_9GAMM|nr:S8 family serine peptidase [Marinicella litoralis]TDR14638.1 subtilisin family serine protease [Marinicella litoralis]